MRMNTAGLFLAALIGYHASAAQASTVNVSVLNVRSGPGFSYRIVGTLSRGTTVHVIARSGSWSHIDRPRTGWCWSAYLSSSTAGSTSTTFVARGTGYYPSNSAIEGGFRDRMGHPLRTLQAFLSGRATYVSVAMDPRAFRYGTKLRIRELENKYHKVIEFRVVDTGGAFYGKGTSRIDICVANYRASLDPTINSRLHCTVVR